jgi:outer membrane immunogenic protein
MNNSVSSTFIGAIVVGTALFGLSLPAAAQSFDATGYATLGYSYVQAANLTNGAVTARGGVRFGRYLGVEGELNFGVNDDRFVFSLPCSVLCPPPAILITSKLRDAEAIYAVGFLPLSPDADLFIRAGYGAAHYTMRPVPDFTETSFNFGAGGDYYFYRSNGVRLDYTRFDNLHQHNLIARQAIGSGTNVWSASYILRF